MAICDARYDFTHIDTGSYGSSNDSGVFRKLGEQFFENKVYLFYLFIYVYIYHFISN